MQMSRSGFLCSDNILDYFLPSEHLTFLDEFFPSILNANQEELILLLAFLEITSV